MKSVFFLSLVLLSTSVFAQDQGFEIRKTKKGFVKVPKSKQFQLGTTEIEGEGSRPAPLTFEKGPQSKRMSLIPLKPHFRSEIAGSAVAPAGVIKSIQNKKRK